MHPSEPADGIASAGGLRYVLRSLHCDGRRGVALALASAALLAVALGGKPLRSALRYDRNALAAGEWWRLATAHLVHLNLEHALADVLALVLLSMLFGRDYSPRACLLVLAGAAAAIDLGLWIFASTVI